MIRRKWWLFLLLLPLLGLSGFVLWAETPLGPLPEAQQALQPDPWVEVDTKPWLVFKPRSGGASTGLIIYPGGRVDPTSYAPLAQAIAANGYQVVIAPMPLNLAVLGTNEASNVIAAYPEVSRWAIGGHSLGGSMAAAYAKDHPDLIEGLVLWASYPASSDDLSKTRLPVLSIYGTRDGLSTQGKVLDKAPLLPGDTRYLAIEGANHAQFGWYGDQPGDPPAAISRQEQQDQIIRATVDFLAELGK